MMCLLVLMKTMEKERVNMTEDNIFETITDYTVNERMIKTLLENKEYQEVQNQIADQIKLFEGLHLEKEQWMVIDRLLSLHAESGALYGRITYQQGYRDCVALLQEMNLIRFS